MCGDDIIRRGKQASKSGRAKEMLDLETFRRLIDECSKFWYKPRLVFAGYGEPLVYPKLEEVMRLCKEKKMYYTIDTNGHLLEKHAESLVLNSCHSINVSLHGDATTHNKIAGVENSFDRVTEGLRKLLDCKKGRTDRNL